MAKKLTAWSNGGVKPQKGVAMEGDVLVNTLVECVGLPQDYTRSALEGLLEKNNVNSENLTLDDLRPLLAQLVQEVLLECKKGL
ncbi:MAG: hypothetical protein KDD22_01135 [Bdellovibrionales bacterium]|nr:hypothetical protein [Bdellovibrionales bacterium]